MRQDLFGPRPNKPRRVLMLAYDAGEFPDGGQCAAFTCRKCGHDSGFIYATKAEIRRGVPCSKCNAEASA